MPYNTRRKSLSLSELGILVPKRQRSGTTATPARDGADEPATKKPRCSHSPLSSPPLTSDASHTVKLQSAGGLQPATRQFKQEQNKQDRIKTEQPRTVPKPLDTPPQSPKIGPYAKIDTEGIKDDIVVAVIKQLEATANKPQTSKEFAAVLANSVGTITASTNPNALIQARLANYLKANWPIVSPCPLAKEHEPVHPRRVFYYLSTMPKQSLPKPSIGQNVPAPRRVVSPELSSASSIADDDDHDAIRARFALSPSPEIDLSSPELDGDIDINGTCDSFDRRTSLSRDSSTTSLSLMHNERAISPPLERQERDFRKIASDLLVQHRSSRQASRKSSAVLDKPGGIPLPTTARPQVAEEADSVVMSVESDIPDEAVTFGIKDGVASLFGNAAPLSPGAGVPYDLSSPLLKPQRPDVRPGATPRSFNIAVSTIDSVMSDYDGKRDVAWAGFDDLQSPETVDLDELETLLEAP